jgi:CxxC motif-containing protein (DUF1111 family)
MRILAATLATSLLTATVGFAATELDPQMAAVLGKALFERDWVPAPASTDSADGLGPLFSARSCSGCHAGPALAARFTEAAEGRVAGRGLVVRFGDAEGRPDPLYGALLQNQAVQGMLPEGRIVLSSTGSRDGSLDVAVTLDRGALDPATRQSVRIAPPLAGRAMLDKIDPAAILARADPDDHDGDGISGRAHMLDIDGTPVLGRYGWKAGATGLDEQIADAFASDLGLSSARRPLPHGDCTDAETDCLAAPTGESGRHSGHELSDDMIDIVSAYVRSLAVPIRAVEAFPGAKLFADAGCAACHVPSMPSPGGETIAAFTDLLLHDMGPDLDDGVGAPGVASAEWRTAPLIAMSGGAGRRYLHDGSASTLDAAIRAHGGESDAARAHYLSLSDAERQALVDFVGSL